ncbi:MAG: FAD-dependent oxidoreductase [Acidimicrobiales bacterium]
MGAAAELAERGARVVLLEREAQLAQHTTGRSSRPVPGELRRAAEPGAHPGQSGGLRSGAVPHQPADVARGHGRRAGRAGVARRRGAWLVPSIRLIDGGECCRIVPVRPEVVEAGVLEPDAADIDVAALHQSFVQRARAAGAEAHPRRRGAPRR